MANVNILPEGSILQVDTQTEEVENTIEPSLTYEIDFRNNRIAGIIDHIEALKQTIYLILKIERYEYLIYPWEYGSEIKGLIGKEGLVVESEYKRRIKDALVQDDRIEDVDNFIFKRADDSLTISFTVFSIYGDFIMDTEVMDNV